MNGLKLPISQSSVDQITPVAVNITASRAANQRSSEQTVRRAPGSSPPRPQRPGNPVAKETHPEAKGYKRLAGQMNEMAQMLDKRYEFSVDEGTNQLVVTVSDSDTGKVIRQMPPKELLDLASQMGEMMGQMGEMMGVFLNEVA